MTYWYPGVLKVIRLARKIHPSTPIILGGIYAQLCYEHALEFSGADLVLTEKDPSSLLKALKRLGIIPKAPKEELKSPFYPAFDLLSRIEYVCLLTSTGCPYRCQYCASHILSPGFTQRNPDNVLEEILFWHREFGVGEFAFYDDALLLNFKTYLRVMLENLSDLNLALRFHTPNAVHAREIKEDTAKLMKLAGFRTVRLGLETSDFTVRQDLDNKLAEGEFERAVGHLLNAGFSSRDIGAYILIGLPGQRVESVIETIRCVSQSGALPFLSEYSPIPHTALWDRAVAHSEYDLASEPLYHNNTLLPCWDAEQRKALPRLKELILEVRQKVDEVE
jgi:radical SAM superfamily enzyme YgiQ (UPF0313 family)